MKILLVRTSSMGDLVHTLPAVEDLARARPDVELHWLCEESFTDIARLHLFVKEVKTLAWRRWRKNLVSRGTWKELSGLKHNLQTEKYDQVLDAQGLLKSAAFARMAGATVTGLDYKSAREGLASWFYRQKYPVAKEHNAVWRNRCLFAQAFTYEFDEEKLNFGVQLLQKDKLSGYPEKYHVCLSAASRDEKLWPEENWRKLFYLMHEADQLPIYLPFGSSAEKERAKRLAQDFFFVTVCPRLNLHEAAALLGFSSSIIGVDTGLLHLGNAFNRPIIGIFTATNPAKTGVQVSPRAKNIGGINYIPNPEQIFSAWQAVCQE